MDIICFQHDSTVAAFMSALKTFNHLSPPYAATVIVELMRDTETGHYYVQLFYKNDTSQLLHKLKLPSTYICLWVFFNICISIHLAVYILRRMVRKSGYFTSVKFIAA